jgi:hypothetical protein
VPRLNKKIKKPGVAPPGRDERNKIPQEKYTIGRKESQHERNNKNQQNRRLPKVIFKRGGETLPEGGTWNYRNWSQRSERKQWS